MTTIDEGENAILRFTVRDDQGVIIPTAEISSFSISLVYQEDDGTWGDILGTWTFTSPSDYTPGIQSDGDGIFEVEVLPSQTGTPGILSAVTTIGFVDPDFFITGSEVLVTTTEDVLEILDVPSIGFTENQFFLADDDGAGIADDDGTLIAA